MSLSYTTRVGMNHKGDKVLSHNITVFLEFELILIRVEMDYKDGKTLSHNTVALPRS